MNENQEAQVINILSEIKVSLDKLSKKDFKISLGIFWTMGYLFTAGFVPDFLTIEKTATFWEKVVILILSFLLWAFALGNECYKILILLVK